MKSLSRQSECNYRYIFWAKYTQTANESKMKIIERPGKVKFKLKIKRLVLKTFV